MKIAYDDNPTTTVLSHFLTSGDPFTSRQVHPLADSGGHRIGGVEQAGSMNYVVTVVARRPEDAPELDPLQRAGVVHLLREGLDTIEFIEGEDGEAVEITDHVIGAHPAGALLKVVIDAPALEVAVEAVIAEILEHDDPLAEWTVDACEGQLRFDVGGEGPVAAQEPEGLAADPATLDTAHRYSKPNRAPTVETKGEKTGASMRALVPQLVGVSLATFGHLTAQDLDGQEVLDESFSVARKDAELAAGAMVYSIDLLIDELFEDIDTLGYSPSVAECQDGLLQLGGSPPQFAHRYTPLFARRLLVVAVMLTERLCRPDFGQLRCVAEELLLRLLLETTTRTRPLPTSASSLRVSRIGSPLSVLAAPSIPTLPTVPTTSKSRRLTS